MNLTQALLAAVTAETACIVFLFGILLNKNRKQDKELAECKRDRKELHEQQQAQAREFSEKLATQQILMLDIWKVLFQEKDKDHENLKKALAQIQKEGTVGI